MPIHFNNPKPIDHDTVRIALEKININLPDEYMTLLTTVSNGGSIEPVMFTNDGDIGVVGFLGISTEQYDLATRVAEYDGDLPEGLVPIADAEGGNLVCIKASGEDTGSIWFWDHELEGNAARKITASLGEFIDGLKPYDDTPVLEGRVTYIRPGFIEQLKREGKL